MDTQEEVDIKAISERIRVYLGDSYSSYYPARLEQNFPRILAKIVGLWGKPGLDAYFGELMVPERHDRQGFPEEVAMEIFRLSTVHSSLGLSKEQAGTGWAGIQDAEIFRKAVAKDKI